MEETRTTQRDGSSYLEVLERSDKREMPEDGRGGRGWGRMYNHEAWALSWATIASSSLTISVRVILSTVSSLSTLQFAGLSPPVPAFTVNTSFLPPSPSLIPKPIFPYTVPPVSSRHGHAPSSLSPDVSQDRMRTSSRSPRVEVGHDVFGTNPPCCVSIFVLVFSLPSHPSLLVSPTNRLECRCNYKRVSISHGQSQEDRLRLPRGPTTGCMRGINALDKSLSFEPTPNGIK